MYRPFITCDDPKGVVECGTIRKSSSCVPKREDKAEKRRIDKRSGTSRSMAYKAGKEEDVVSYQSPSSFQLLQVSRGAHKLNQMIDAWSNGASYGGGRQPKDIAKDLLSGALDLQESLLMLGKLQEPSHYLKKKHKGRVYDAGSEAASSVQVRDHSYQTGLQKPRHSADGSSRDSIEELRKVIEDGHVMQNLIPPKGYQQRNYFSRRLESALDVPSTSSSEPSLDRFGDTNANTDSSSSSSRVPQNKRKGPNLIARLMGLEDSASKVFQQPVAQRKVQAEKISSPTRPVFEIETPKLRKPHCILENTDPEERTLKEVLETMHYKGLLKSPDVKLLKSRSYQSGSHVYLDHEPTECVPPIVLIKPMRALRTEPNDVPEQSGLEEENLSRKRMQRKMEVQGVHAATLTEYKDDAHSASRMKLGMDTPDVQEKSRSEGAKHLRSGVEDVEEKEVRIIDEEEQTAGANVRWKLEAEEVNVKRHAREGVPKDRKVIVRGAEEKGVATNSKKSPKAKASDPVADHQQNVDKIADKKVNKINKAASTGKKPQERQHEKAKSASRSVKKDVEKPRNTSSSQDQSKLIFRKPRNGSLSTMAQKKVQMERSAYYKTSSVQTTQSTNHESKQWRRKEKTTKFKQGEDHKGINRASGYASVDEITVSAAKHFSEENANASEIEIEGRENDGQIPEHETTKPQSECQQVDAKTSKESADPTCCGGNDDTSPKAENPLKVLLLSNLSFVSYVDELFHLDQDTHVNPPISVNEEPKASESALILDYTKEFVERRSRPDSQVLNPFVPAYRSYLRVSLSLDKLVEEICIGIDTLESYSVVAAIAAADSVSADTLYGTLETDLGCRGVVTGIWETGWRFEFSCDDVDQTVVDLENLLLRDLIKEVFL